MNKLWYVFGLLFLLAGIALMGWLCVYVMLYGGIMAAVSNWGVNESAVVWGVIRAFLCELGLIPGAIVAIIGKSMLAWGILQTAHERMFASFGRLGRRR